MVCEHQLILMMETGAVEYKCRLGHSTSNKQVCSQQYKPQCYVLSPKEKLRKLIKIVEEEVKNATSKFNSFHNSHEGWGVLREEYLELEEVLRLNEAKNPDRTERLMEEATHVAAMAIRLMIDCGNL